MFNEIDGSYDDVAISTFKTSLPVEHDLRKSLTGKPVTSVRLLMDRIDKYRRIEEDQLQGKGKAKVILQERRDSRSDRSQNNRPRRDFVGQSGSTNTQAVNAVFREPVQQVLEKVKNEPFFRWLNKMARDLVNHNQNLYCQYHQDHGNTTEDCRNHLESCGIFCWEVEAPLASLQWPRRPSEFGVSGKCCSETSSGHHKRHIRCPRKNRILSLRDNVSILLLRRKFWPNAEES